MTIGMVGFMRSAKRTALALAASLLAIGAAAGNEQTTLTVPAENLGFLLRYVAEDEGLWSKQGLDVSIKHIQGIGATNAVIAGSADFGFASGPTVTRANARGQKLVALATTINQSDEWVVVRKDIAVAAQFDAKAPLATRAAILKGLTIATGGAGAIPDVVLKVVAKQAGLGPDAVRTAPMQPPEFMAAFARKSIDGFVSGPPFTQIALTDGSGVVVADPSEPPDYTPVSSALLLARASFCPEHRAICEKLVHGVAEAARFVHGRRAETLAVMKRHFGSYGDKVLEASYEGLVKMVPVPPVTTAAELENADQLNIAAGFMSAADKLPDYNGIIDNQFAR